MYPSKTVRLTEVLIKLQGVSPLHRSTFMAVRVICLPSAVEEVDFPHLCLQTTAYDDATLPGDSPPTCED